MSVKKPNPRFGIRPLAEEKTSPVDYLEELILRKDPEEISVWKSETPGPYYTDKEKIFGAQNGQEAPGALQFMRMYEKRLSKLTIQEEDQLDREVIERERAKRFAWAQKNNPNMTYEEFIHSCQDPGHRIEVPRHSGSTFGHADSAPDDHMSMEIELPVKVTDGSNQAGE